MLDSRHCASIPVVAAAKGRNWQWRSEELVCPPLHDHERAQVLHFPACFVPAVLRSCSKLSCPDPTQPDPVSLRQTCAMPMPTHGATMPNDDTGTVSWYSHVFLAQFPACSLANGRKISQLQLRHLFFSQDTCTDKLVFLRDASPHTLRPPGMTNPAHGRQPP